MSRAWRGDLLSFLPFLQFALATWALDEGSLSGWTLALPGVALLGLIGWLYALRLARAINDTPTSRVASAAQGYVELHGVAQPNDGLELGTPHLHLPCLWYRYRVERERDNKWEQVESGESDAPFDLEDGSGRCTINPVGAHVQTTHKETRREGDLRYTEEVLLKGDRLYALGLFRSVRAEDLVLDVRRDEGELLAEWKQDKAELHRRFDLDGDGDISPKEWLLARQAARREIARRHAESRAQPTRHHMQRPGDRRPYLLSNLPPDALGRRFTWWSRLQLGLLLACLAGLTWVLKAGA